MMLRVAISEYDEQGGSMRGMSVNGAATVVPTDGVDLAGGLTRGIYLGGAGNVAVTMANGNDVVFTGLAAGVVHNIAVRAIKSTGTTATNILALY